MGFGAAPRESVRSPAVAGAFYPSDPTQLAAMVDRLLATASTMTFDGELTALLVPHAGYEFSGSVAATAFRCLQGRRVDTVILIGVAHRYPVDGAAIFPGTAFATPFGRVPINMDAARWLTEQSSFIVMDAAAHEEEHSLEVELPFLQRVLPQAQIVPLLMGNPNLDTCQVIGDALARLVRRETAAQRTCLLIASSDMSHYPTEDEAHLVDHRSLDAVLSGQPEQVHRVSAQIMSEGLPELFCTFCGEGALKTMMFAAQALGATRVTQLRYATSADVPQGDSHRVVGYGAVAFSKIATSAHGESLPPTAAEAAPAWHGEEPQLLRLARQAIAGYLAQRATPLPSADPAWPPSLREPAAVFVTLRRGEQLRGCVGTTEAREAVGLAVQRYAIAAATEDTRFPPVTQEELGAVTLEISVLSPLRRLKDVVEIRPYVDGVTVRQGSHVGVFLPQVWDETGWRREEFLRQLCAQKAGLPPDAWQDPSAELYVFTVHSFSE